MMGLLSISVVITCVHAGCVRLHLCIVLDNLSKLLTLLDKAM
jgi:hypothetical protein